MLIAIYTLITKSNWPRCCGSHVDLIYTGEIARHLDIG